MWRNVIALLTLVLILALGDWAVAAEDSEAMTDPARTDLEFTVQGEYEGTMQVQGEEIKFGGQIVALGDGKFHGVAFRGGLPGAGWDGSDKAEAEGELKDGVAVFVAGEGNRQRTVKIQNGVMTATDAEGKQIGKLTKVNRKSPTLGAKPPKSALVLFDGTSADKFEGGRMTKDGLLIEGATSKQKFQSFTIHLEFRTPFMPKARGQGRGNSGFYAQGRYEVQILDSFGLEGRDNECGGIYTVAPPTVNMCLPPLSWQTYDVDFTAAEYQDGKKVKNARMTVRHNGVLIHENQEIDHATTAAPLPEGPQPGPVFLQNHGNPVRFRNIWVVEKK